MGLITGPIQAMKRTLEGMINGFILLFASGHMLTKASRAKKTNLVLMLIVLLVVGYFFLFVLWIIASIIFYTM